MVVVSPARLDFSTVGRHPQAIRHHQHPLVLVSIERERALNPVRQVVRSPFSAPRWKRIYSPYESEQYSSGTPISLWTFGMMCLEYREPRPRYHPGGKDFTPVAFWIRSIPCFTCLLVSRVSRGAASVKNCIAKIGSETQRGEGTTHAASSSGPESSVCTIHRLPWPAISHPISVNTGPYCAEHSIARELAQSVKGHLKCLNRRMIRGTPHRIP